MWKQLKRFYSKEVVNPLTKILSTSIKLNGPLSVHDYMNLCLIHPQYGYYMTRDVFGEKGDFITSPEISQMFGEMMGIWYIQHWQHQLKGQKLQSVNGKFQLVELGPGRGTLMMDMLRTMSQFEFIYRNVERVCLVEPSPFLRTLQKETLIPFSEKGLKIDWFDRVEDIPPQYSFWMAHEVFDAMPVYLFQVQFHLHRKQMMVGEKW
jgi:NADH dehydrogenase [ubiquinone] 1 alpha subcomplex assembly factor 7